ncbi:glycoside hydrolase [Pedobacter sp. NJ-S-72]
MTGQQQDLEARLHRMAWIRDQYKLVIGTEVGNDYAANTIAFGHGMTTPVIAWSDPDMRKNKNSKYYIGAYYSSDGGVPGRYGLQAPMKDEYLYIYFDNRFNVPLFQLVYNNAVITSHHWECGSLKIPGEIKNTELKEILYNVPPMYHLNQSAWAKYKDVISKHMKVFSRTHELAVKEEMTGFEWLTKDKLVQRTAFGKVLEIIANFSNTPFIYQSNTIPAHELLIHNLLTDKYEFYNP